MNVQCFCPDINVLPSWEHHLITVLEVNRVMFSLLNSKKTKTKRWQNSTVIHRKALKSELEFFQLEASFVGHQLKTMSSFKIMQIKISMS